jgi:phosphopantothenoylcysteine decarboxylase/phosphopantothenate--cysteine ligase
MGFSIAERAALRGANVTLVAGPVSHATPAGVTRVDVVSARDMQAAVDAALGKDLQGAHALVMAAAVADFRPQISHGQKIKKTKSMSVSPEDAAPGDTIPTTNAQFVPLAENPDILSAVGAARARAKKTGPVLVGFALETGSDDDIVAYATRKRTEKGVDFVVANRAEESLGADATRVFIVRAESVEAFPAMHKTRIADIVLDEVAVVLNR